MNKSKKFDRQTKLIQQIYDIFLLGDNVEFSVLIKRFSSFSLNGWVNLFENQQQFSKCLRKSKKKFAEKVSIERIFYAMTLELLALPLSCSLLWT